MLFRSVNSGGTLPDLLVQPEGIDNQDEARPEPIDEAEDPLLDLFRQKAELSGEEFHVELRKQRGASRAAEAVVPA